MQLTISPLEEYDVLEFTGSRQECGFLFGLLCRDFHQDEDAWWEWDDQTVYVTVWYEETDVALDQLRILCDNEGVIVERLPQQLSLGLENVPVLPEYDRQVVEKPVSFFSRINLWSLLAW